MADFLEERLPLDVRMGASYADEFNVEITTTRGDSENRRLVHPFPIRHFSVQYTLEHADLWNRVISLYHRAYGMFAGFRVKCLDDLSTNGTSGIPTAIDHPCALVSPGVYQLQKRYGVGGTPLSIGLPVRTIFKPIAGSVRVAIGSVEATNTPTTWAVDTTTGKVTFSANKNRNISAITKAAQAVATVGPHSYVIGESVIFSGVVGMTQINGMRGQITAKAGTTITVNINSSAFSTYTSNGTTDSQPQASESVTAGCYFDIPCRFNSRIDVTHVSVDYREAGSIDIIELVNP